MDSVPGGATHSGVPKRLATPQRCAICARRLDQGAHYVEETGESPEPRQSWMLCGQCYDAVQAQLERVVLHSPVRVRVAVGVVASERAPQPRRTDWEQLDDKAINRLLIGIFWVVFAIHALVFIAVVAVVAHPH